MNVSSCLRNFFPAILLITSSQVFADKIIMHTVMDTQRNMPMSQMPLPANWKILTPKSNEDPRIIGPGGIKIYNRLGGSYVFSQDPYMQQIYTQSGQQMRPPIDVQQIVEQDLKPQLNQRGLKFVRMYAQPEIAQRSQTYFSKLYKSMPSQEYFYSAGTDWDDDKGNSVFITVDQMISEGQGTVFWYYSLTILEAPHNNFEQAKKALVYGIANTQDNPAQIQAHNLSEQQKSNQSWSQHNARMKQNQQNFERQQAIHKSTSDAINRSINSTYENQNATSDRIQEKTINVIRDESTVTNPHDGEQYQVDAGANQYWINNDGEYIPSNDSNYNPNLDPENNREWQQVEPEY